LTPQSSWRILPGSFANDVNMLYMCVWIIYIYYIYICICMCMYVYVFWYLTMRQWEGKWKETSPIKVLTISMLKAYLFLRYQRLINNKSAKCKIHRFMPWYLHWFYSILDIIALQNVSFTSYNNLYSSTYD
jgi:hypothetical protein